MSKELIYRISFYNQETLYELYAKKVQESEMMGFIEIEEFVFGETTSVVVDPSEERMKVEFSGVKQTFVPMHSVVRIDVVDKHGVSKAHDYKPSNGKVSVFPGSNFNRKDDN